MSDDNSLAAKLQVMLARAEEDLGLSHEIIDGGHHRVGVSRAYYAAFYAMEAALLSMDITRSKHNGVISAFNRHFVSTGLLPSHFGALISDLFRYRNIADYEFESRISEAEARSRIQAASQIVAAIAAYLVREGFIDPKDIGG